MTKKDYIMLAEVAKTALTTREYGSIDSVRLVRFLDDLCVKLKQDNPRFNREKFLQACGR